MSLDQVQDAFNPQPEGEGLLVGTLLPEAEGVRARSRLRH